MQLKWLPCLALLRSVHLQWPVFLDFKCHGLNVQCLTRWLLAAVSGSGA